MRSLVKKRLSDLREMIDAVESGPVTDCNWAAAFDALVEINREVDQIAIVVARLEPGRDRAI